MDKLSEGTNGLINEGRSVKEGKNGNSYENSEHPLPLSCASNHTVTECECPTGQRDEPQYGVSLSDPSPNLSTRSVLEKGTKCILCDLLFSSTMNGALCKVVGSYREDEDRYPVYVYKTKETALIKASNLKAIKTKTAQKTKRREKAKPQKQALYHPVTRSVTLWI